MSSVTNARMAELEAEVERLRQDCSEAYQVVGVLATRQLDPGFGPIAEEEFVRVLDNLSAAVDGRPRPHEELLPWPR